MNDIQFYFVKYMCIESHLTGLSPGAGLHDVHRVFVHEPRQDRTGTHTEQSPHQKSESSPAQAHDKNNEEGQRGSDHPMVEVEAAVPPREHEGQVDSPPRALPLSAADESKADKREKKSN